MTAEKFGRSTLRDIEARIEGAKWRIEVQRDLVTWGAIVALAKWEHGLSHEAILGRDAIDLDERITAAMRPRPMTHYETEMKSEHDARVRERLDQIAERRAQRRMLPPSE